MVNAINQYFDQPSFAAYAKMRALLVKGTVSRPSMRYDALDLVPDFSSVRHLEFD